MTDEFHVSPSQVSTFLSASRKWALEKIGGFARVGNRFSERGTGVHAVLEAWSREAKPPDLTTEYGQIAYPALAHIPPPMTAGVIAERRVEWRSPAGNLWVFLKDLEKPGADLTRIWDYKTFSRPEFNLTAEQLRDSNPQSLQYAAHAFLEYDSASVETKWLYLHANKPRRCLPVIAQHDRRYCLERFALLDRVASVMLDHRRANTDPFAFPACAGQCGAYGGCPFKIVCNLSPEDNFMSQADQLQGQNTNDFLAMIAAASQGKTGPTPGAQAKASPVQVPGLTTAPANSALPSFLQPPNQATPIAQPPAIVFPPPTAAVEVMQSPPTQAPAMPWAQPIASVEKPKRSRATKAEMAERRMAEATDPMQVTQLPAIEPEQPAAETGPLDQTFMAPVRPRVSADDDQDPLTRDLLIALANNSAFAASPAADVVSRAIALASALRQVS
jgi:hypothetical protein